MCNCTMKGLSVPCVLFLTFFLFATPVAESAAVRADLTHVDSGRGFTKRKLLLRMVARSMSRVASLRSPARAPAVTAPAARGTLAVGAEYLVHLGAARGADAGHRQQLRLDAVRLHGVLRPAVPGSPRLRLQHLPRCPVL